MTDAYPGSDPFDDLTEEFASRWREGERPSIEEYAARFPQWADDIRAMFPAILLMEELKPSPEDHPTPNTTPPSSPVPDRLGEYRIVREIGRGGMGVVYEAHQESLGRRVAIKVLPAHLFANEKMRARFRRESQAAARLHHTNIVPVFGTGDQDGLCYYVMQLIHGKSLDAMSEPVTGRGGSSPCSEEESPRPSGSTTLAAACGPSENPSPVAGERAKENGLGPFSHRAVAQIGLQVADALAYAHAQGVLHRDVKPSNLLLDERGTVWVTDFGVAKIVEEANLTGSGELVGTLKYMPPERFLGQSDARGDVYSLGITLYEMVARRPAFPDTTPPHLIQLINQGNPPALRKLDSTVPADLETIILKAAARDGSHRYQSAAEMADDLRRFLDDRPVLARRIGTARQIWRWCRRNRVVSGLAAAALSLLLITSVVSVTAYLRTSTANKETAAANGELKKALGAEQTQRARAEHTSILALEALNRIYDHFAPSRIVVTPGLPAGSAAEEGIELPSQPLLSPEVVPLLEELLGFYEQLAGEGGDHPKLQSQAAEANQRIGDIRQRLAQFEQAITAYRKAAELYARLSSTGMGDSIRIKAARTDNELGRVLQGLQRIEESRDAFQQARTILTGASEELASRPEYRFELARTCYFQSKRETVMGPPPLERDRGPGHRPPDDFGRGPPPRRGGPPSHGPGEGPPSRRAVAILETLVKDYPSVPEYRHLLACCYRDGPPDRPGHGSPGLNTDSERALKLLRQLVKEFPKVADYRYDLCETLARVCFSGLPLPPELTAAAKPLLEEAFTLSSDLVTDYPNIPQYRASQALVQEKLSLLHYQMKHPEVAEKMLRDAVALQAGLVKQHPEVLAYNFSLSLMQSSLARLVSDRGNVKEARVLLEASTTQLAALLDKDHRLGFVGKFLGPAYRELAQVLTRLGEKELASQALHKAEGFGPGRGPDPFGPRERRGDR
jgi:serine/threonine protein kinase/tetratricopeptide (TPR) repeat protein